MVCMPYLAFLLPFLGPGLLPGLPFSLPSLLVPALGWFLLGALPCLPATTTPELVGPGEGAELVSRHLWFMSPASIAD